MNKEKGSPSRSTRVVEVIPIARGVAKPSLSYFTTRDVAPGDFVKVPLRKQQVYSVVIAVHSATDAKTALKSKNYSLRKLTQNEDKKQVNASLPRAIFEAAMRTAEYYATPIGDVLSTIIPKALFRDPELSWGTQDGDKEEMVDKTLSAPAPKNEALVIQLERSERMSQYKSVIRESLAKKKSIMLMAPTEEEALRAYDTLSHGIEDYTHLFSLRKSVKDLKKVIQEVRESTHPILLITTPAGVTLDRPDLDTIILERESSRAYRTMSRPYIHYKTFLEFYATRSKKRLILGDSVLSLPTLERERQGEHREFFPITWRHASGPETKLVDMKEKGVEPKDPSAKRFRVISPELEELVRKALEEEKGIFLFGARKGLAPSTVCEDCGTVLPCQNCGAPVVLYERGKNNREYICHACSAKRNSHTVCDTCKSWRLTPLGIGTDRIKEELSEKFPKNRIHILDKNHAPTRVRARKIALDFYEYGGVLIGTEQALLYLDKVPYSALVSADALFSIPDFAVNERIFRIVTHLREMAEKKCIIQTRNIGKQVLAWAASGNVLDFYREEMSERKSLLYPPYSIFIKISGKNIESVHELFSKWNPDKIRDSLIIRLPRDKWPHRELIRELSLLTPDLEVKVDPESIL